MSEVSSRLENLAAEYIARRIALDDFRLAFSALYFQARQSPADQQANALASKMMGPLAELGRHDRDEQSFREELSTIVRVSHFV